jgi:hypothetical protein
MLGDILFWAAVAFVVVMLALPVAGNLSDWRETGLHVPFSMHSWAIAFALGGYAFHEGPIGLFWALAAYAIYAAFGSHLQRSMLHCEQQAAQGSRDDDKAKLLRAELEPFKQLSRQDLIAKMKKPIEKDLVGPDGLSYHLRIEVLPEIYRWEGGNIEHFSKLDKAVEDGAGIKVIGMLAPAGQSLLRRARRSCLCFRTDVAAP